METLKAYFSSINPRLFHHVSGKPKEFIDLFREQHFLTEEAFAQELCGDNYNTNYYSELKSRTLNILQALAIVSDKKGEILINKKFHKCQKKFLLGQKFLTQGKRSEGIRLIKQAYQLATEYDFMHLACELSSILYHDHVYYNRNKRMAIFYANKMKKYLNDYSAEKEAEYYFFNVVGNVDSLTSTDILQEAFENISRKQGDSIKYKVYEATISVLCGLYSGEYENLVISCNKILLSFKTKKGAYHSHYLFFLRNKGTAETALGRYEQAAKSYQEAEQYTSHKPYNLYALQFYKTLNALHAGQYKLAYDLLQKNKRCKIESIRLQFAIIEAYLCFLVHTRHLQINKIFRIGKYLNETFKAQQDKQGDNVNILIAELLVYLAKDRGKFIDRIEAIQHYIYRHLNGKENERARWFMKILCLMPHPKVNFHPVALQRKAKRYIDLLQNNPARLGENFTGEIIPFTDLLDMILERVMKKVA